MRYKIIILLALLFLISMIDVVPADYLEVSRDALIKEQPTSDGVLIERAEPGVILKLLDDGAQTNGYYKVIAPESLKEGWVYRTLVRRYEGETQAEDDSVTTSEATTIIPGETELTPDEKRYAARHLRLGKPQAVYDIYREGYALALDARLKVPLWVQYELTREERTGPATRSDDFRADTSVPLIARAQLPDYARSGYDRGHMAPANDMKRSDEVMSESFYLSNMAPQIGIGFNRHIWKDLEMAANGWVDQRGTLTIITGPIFAAANGEVKYKVIGEDMVAVPTHFYKIIVDANNSDDIKALAFKLPNQKLSGEDYAKYLCSIDEIEKLTSLDFLSELPDSVEESIESQVAENVW